MDKEYNEYYNEIAKQNNYLENEIDEITELKETRKEIWNTFKKKMKKLHPGISIELIKSTFRHHFNFDPV